jgi:hypothetical protein
MRRIHRVQHVCRITSKVFADRTDDKMERVFEARCHAPDPP